MCLQRPLDRGLRGRKPSIRLPKRCRQSSGLLMLLDRRALLVPSSPLHALYYGLHGLTQVCVFRAGLLNLELLRGVHDLLYVSE